MNSLHTLLRKAIDAALSGATVVTPNEGAARFVRHACELRMARGDKPWHTPRVLSWGAFVGWLWREAMVAGAVDRVLLSRDQQRVLWEQVVAESNDGAGLMNVAGAAVRAREAWELVQAYGVPFASSLFDRAPETRAFAGWASEFARNCTRNGWMDSARAADELVRSATSWCSVQQSVVTYAFDEFTPQQVRVLQVLCGAGVRVDQLAYVAQLRLDGSVENDHVRQMAATDEQDEIRRAATWARNRLREKSSAQIGVIIPQLRDLRSTVEHIFEEMLHPERFLSDGVPGDKAFELAAPGTLNEQGLVDTALRALRLAAGTLPLEEACRLVRSPYIGGSGAERTARAALDLALRRCKTPEITPAEVLDKAREGRCYGLTKQLAAFASGSAPFAESHAPGKWAEHISAALTALGWPGDLTPAEYEVHESFVELLRRFSALEVVRPAKLRAAQVVSELARMVREQQFRPASSHAPVQLLTMADAAGSVFDHLWICGMTDDVWPQRIGTNPFIPAPLQLQYDLPHCSPQRESERAASVLSRMYGSAGEVIVSWSKRDKEREFRPALQVRDLQVALPDCCEPVAPTVTELMPRAEADVFADEQAPPAEPGMQPGGTRTFEYQSACPFRAFAQIRLYARELDEAYTGPNYIDRGKMIERVLQLAWEQVGNWHRLNELFETPALEQVLEHAVDTAVHDCIPQPGRWFDNYRAVERTRLTKIAQNWFSMERQRSPFDSTEHQKDLEITVGGMTVKGCIDRIDHLPGGELVVIDYKSGDRFKVRMWETPRMEAPQLPLYVTAQPTGEVAGVAFGIARTSRCELVGYTRRREVLGKTNGNCECDMGHQIGEWRNELEGLAASYLLGDAAVFPKHARKTCAWCHVGALCRVKEHSRADVEAAEAVNDDE